MNILKCASIACLFVAFGLGATHSFAAPTSSNPQPFEGQSQLQYIASKMTEKQQSEAKKLEARVNRALSGLQDDKIFLDALAKKDKKTVGAMIKRAARTDAPIRLSFEGEGEPSPGKIKWTLTLTCCPMTISLRVIF